MVAVMRKLVYSMNVSLDGYMEDEDGRFDWSEPDPEVHRFINAEHREAGGHIYGRGMWGTMKGWATLEGDEVTNEFAAIWRAMPKYVVSSTLAEAPGATLLREPEADIARLKEQDGGPLYIGGAETAARLAHLVDEVDVYAFPVVVAGGKPAWTVPMRLALLESRTFPSGVVFSRYDVVR
jgi:dihydrofolate reductase